MRRSPERLPAYQHPRACERWAAGLREQRCGNGDGPDRQGVCTANAITMVVQQLSTVFIQGISNASSIITGHTLGAGDTERAQRQGVTFLGLGTVIGVLAGGLIMILRLPGDQLLQCDGGNQSHCRTADAGCGRDRHLSIHELYSHKRRTAGRRGYKILDACGYPVSVDRLHSSRLSGGPCMASARVLDLYLPED